MNIALYHGKTRSALIIDEDIIEYTNKIHKFLSEGDYSMLKTELMTYGHSAANEVKDYLLATRNLEVSHE